jgi:hypothetical protein
LHAQEEQARRRQARGELRSFLIPLTHLFILRRGKGVVGGVRAQSGVDTVDDRLLDVLVAKELRKLLAQYSLEETKRKETYSLANLDKGKNATAKGLELKKSLLFGTTLRGASGTLAQGRAVAGDLIAVAVEGSQALDEIVTSSKSGSPELILVLALAALGTHVHGTSIYAGGQEREHGRLNRNACVAAVGAAGALLLEGAEGSVTIEGYASG